MSSPSSTDRVVIVGAGPAGVRAAQTLVAAGVKPVVIDEAARAGGQIYRRPPLGFQRDARTLYGFEATRAQSVHRAFDSLVDHIDYRPQTLVWHADGSTLELMSQAARAHPVTAQLHYSHLVLCTGAVDRTVPFEGWTLPGVFTLGGAQVALKAQGCVVGERVVLAGCGPLLYLVAYQYVRAGAHVLAVLDTSSFAMRVSAVPALALQPAVFAKGLYYLAWLKTHRIRIVDGVRDWAALDHIDGTSLNASDKTQRVRAVRWTDAHGRIETIGCDALATGFGLRSETQLADLLGCEFDFDTMNRQWLPRRSAAGRTSLSNVYVAGDGAGIAGADAAEASGERAALALLDDLGHTAGRAAGRVSNAARAGALDRRLAVVQRFRGGIEKAFAPPWDRCAAVPDDLTVCRCEAVSAGEIRAVARLGVSEMNRMKAVCRAGMGRCQGRMCAAAAAEVFAAALGCEVSAVGRWRAQPPVKPVPLPLASLDGGDLVVAVVAVVDAPPGQTQPQPQPQQPCAGLEGAPR